MRDEADFLQQHESERLKNCKIEYLSDVKHEETLTKDMIDQIVLQGQLRKTTEYERLMSDISKMKETCEGMAEYLEAHKTESAIELKVLTHNLKGDISRIQQLEEKTGEEIYKIFSAFKVLKSMYDKKQMEELLLLKRGIEERMQVEAGRLEGICRIVDRDIVHWGLDETEALKLRLREILKEIDRIRAGKVSDLSVLDDTTITLDALRTDLAHLKQSKMTKLQQHIAILSSSTEEEKNKYQREIQLSKEREEHHALFFRSQLREAVERVAKVAERSLREIDTDTLKKSISLEIRVSALHLQAEVDRLRMDPNLTYTEVDKLRSQAEVLKESLTDLQRADEIKRLKLEDLQRQGAEITVIQKGLTLLITDLRASSEAKGLSNPAAPLSKLRADCLLLDIECAQTASFLPVAPSVINGLWSSLTILHSTLDSIRRKDLEASSTANLSELQGELFQLSSLATHVKSDALQWFGQDYQNPETDINRGRQKLADKAEVYLKMVERARGMLESMTITDTKGEIARLWEELYSLRFDIDGAKREEYERLRQSLTSVDPVHQSMSISLQDQQLSLQNEVRDPKGLLRTRNKEELTGFIRILDQFTREKGASTKEGFREMVAQLNAEVRGILRTAEDEGGEDCGASIDHVRDKIENLREVVEDIRNQEWNLEADAMRASQIKKDFASLAAATDKLRMNVEGTKHLHLPALSDSLSSFRSNCKALSRQCDDFRFSTQTTQDQVELIREGLSALQEEKDRLLAAVWEIQGDEETERAKKEENEKVRVELETLREQENQRVRDIIVKVGIGLEVIQKGSQVMVHVDTTELNKDAAELTFLLESAKESQRTSYEAATNISEMLGKLQQQYSLLSSVESQSQQQLALSTSLKKELSSKSLQDLQQFIIQAKLSTDLDLPSVLESMREEINDLLTSQQILTAEKHSSIMKGIDSMSSKVQQAVVLQEERRVLHEINKIRKEETDRIIEEISILKYNEQQRLTLETDALAREVDQTIKELGDLPSDESIPVQSALQILSNRMVEFSSDLHKTVQKLDKLKETFEQIKLNIVKVRVELASKKRKDEEYQSLLTELEMMKLSAEDEKAQLEDSELDGATWCASKLTRLIVDIEEAKYSPDTSQEVVIKMKKELDRLAQEVMRIRASSSEYTIQVGEMKAQEALQLADKRAKEVVSLRVQIQTQQIERAAKPKDSIVCS